MDTNTKPEPEDLVPFEDPNWDELLADSTEEFVDDPEPGSPLAPPDASGPVAAVPVAAMAQDVRLRCEELQEEHLARLAELPPLVLDPVDPLPPPTHPGADPGVVSPKARSLAPWIAAGAVGAVLGMVAVLVGYQPQAHTPTTVATKAPRPVQAADDSPPSPTPPATEAWPTILTPVRVNNEPPPVKPMRPDNAPLPPVPQPNPSQAVAEAEQTWRKALADLREAQSAYRSAATEYFAGMQKGDSGPLSPTDRARAADRLQRLQAVVRDKQRVAAEKLRLWEEAKRALSHDKAPS
jgi:hypothetical protein